MLQFRHSAFPFDPQIHVPIFVWCVLKLFFKFSNKKPPLKNRYSFTFSAEQNQKLKQQGEKMEKNNLADKYTYRVEWSEEDHVHIARCLEFPSLITHGNTIQKALTEIEKVVTECIKWMEEEKESIPEPFSTKKIKGNLTIKVPSEIHKKLVIKSAEEGVSINQYILSKIS
ncbi:MAG: type II toxin-antitoxin system HicB family antitoxin [Planctomycetaceae bacterium]|jgi:predicted RNase H-like HicB family nuclease|nr:type II toxin-antitoxin system HicB family antitoxin [Planctomycetaceae bacterium]